MHMYTVCLIYLQKNMKFCWAVSEASRWQTVSVVYLILDKFVRSKGAPIPKKIRMKQNAHLHNYNVLQHIQKGHNSQRKKNNQKFRQMCVSTRV